MAGRRFAVATVVVIAAPLIAQEEPEEEGEPQAMRVHDIAWVAAEARHAPFVVQPYGALLISRHGGEVDAVPGESRLGDDDVEEAPRDETREIEIARAGPLGTPEEIIGALQVVLQRAASAGDHEAPILRADGDRLHVTAAAQLQEVAAAALEALERAMAARVTVECLIVPLAALDRHAPRWRETGPLLPAEAFEACLGEPQARLLAASGRPGQGLASTPRRVGLFNTATEVNQTGVIPVNNPIITAPLAGDRLEARALSHPARDSLRIDLALGRYRWSPRRLDMGPDLGVYEPPAGTQEVFSTTLIVPRGKAVVAASLENPAAALLVRAEMQPADRAAPRSLPEGRSVRVYDLAALLDGPVRRWPVPRLPASDRGVGFAEALRDVSLIGLTDDEHEEGFLDLSRIGTRLVLVTDNERHAQARQAHLASLERAWSSAQVDVEQWRLPRAVYLALRQAAGEGGILTVGWEKGLLGEPGVERRRHSATGVAGAALGIFAASTRSYLVDVNQVSGGTGFAIVEASHPELRTCGTGLDLRLQVHLRGSNQARLRLEGASATVLEEREVEAAIPTTLYLTESSRQAGEARPTGSAQANQPLGVLKKVRLTLPVQEAHRWSVELDVPLERDVLLDADVAEDGTATVLVGRVRRVE